MTVIREKTRVEYYLHICNTPETACDICAPLHNTVHLTSDLESMPPHHQNCKCTLVLLDEAYIQSLENTNKKSDDNFWTKLLDGFQTALDLAGFIPGFGEIADGTNAAIYFARGDYFNASLSATAMIPFAGWLSTGSKLGRKALKTADKVGYVTRIANKADDVSGVVKGAGSKVKFGSDAKTVDKLNLQMNKRGWTNDTVIDIVDNSFTKRKATNRATGNSATVYYNKDGSHVIVDDVTNEVVQVSNKADPNWQPDPSIVDPYLP